MGNVHNPHTLCSRLAICTREGDKRGWGQPDKYIVHPDDYEDVVDALEKYPTVATPGMVIEQRQILDPGDSFLVFGNFRNMFKIRLYEGVAARSPEPFLYKRLVDYLGRDHGETNHRSSRNQSATMQNYGPVSEE